MINENFDFRAYMATNIIGAFAFDKAGKMIDKRLFPKDPEIIANRLSRIRNGDIIPEEEEILKNLVSCGIKEVIWDKKDAKWKGMSCIFVPDNVASTKLRDEFRKIALDLRWCTTQAEINDILSKVNVLLAKGEIKKVRKDDIIKHAIGVLDEVVKDSNSLAERMKEWYGLHFPELANIVKGNEKYAQIVLKYGNKKNIKEADIANYVNNSAGMDFSEDDIKEVQVLAGCVSNLLTAKNSLENYIESICNKNIPNITAITGHILAARMLLSAGSLEKMSRMPSSTIQLLGSEKSLFRHMKDKERFKSPKYGILFAHQYIQNAPDKLKGKVARLIAAKVSLAAKTDFFSKENKGDELKKQLDEEVAKLGVNISS